MKPTKQVIVIRKDLKMRTGKMVAQGAHASMAAIMERCRPLKLYDDPENERTHLILNLNEQLDSWLNGIFTKICVYVNSEQELLDLYDIARQRNIICSLIRDNGLTEFKGVLTYTAVAIGPDYNDVVDSITGHLPLL